MYSPTLIITFPLPTSTLGLSHVILNPRPCDIFRVTENGAGLGARLVLQSALIFSYQEGRGGEGRGGEGRGGEGRGGEGRGGEGRGGEGRGG